MNTLIGRKIDQTQKFLDNGKRIPVTLISVTDNAVLQVKTLEKDGYAAMQLGFGTKKKANKATAGHSSKAGFEKAADYVREVRLADGDAPVAGESLAVDSVFKPGDVVTVSGTSKGKGFAGVVKRHGFHGGPKTHGQSDRHRAPGSIGQTTTPGRVYRGKKMAGRMGSDKVTVSNLTVVGVDSDTKMLIVSGLVPGSKQTIVTVTKTGERKNFSELLELKIKREALEAIEAEKAAKIAEIEAAKAAKEAEKAAKLAEKEAAKAPQEKDTEETKETEETKVEEVATAEEVVADATETVVVAEETVGTSVEEVKVEATVSEPEIITKEAAEEAEKAEVAESAETAEAAQEVENETKETEEAKAEEEEKKV